MPFKFTKLEIPDVVLVEPVYFPDERGTFAETYKRSDFSANGIPNTFVQDDQTNSKKGVLRGLHYQLKQRAQGKLVRVAHGRVFDVAVDIRKSSATYSKWVGTELSASNGRMLWVPEGFAHGFVALENNTVFIYKKTTEYAKEYERGIIWNDPALGIRWPIKRPILLERDRLLPPLDGAENNF